MNALNVIVKNKLGLELLLTVKAFKLLVFVVGILDVMGEIFIFLVTDVAC